MVDVSSRGRRPEAMGALLAEPKEQSVSPTAVRYDPDSRRRAQVFTSIYRRNAWNGRETRSGPGSGTEATAALREWLPEVLEELGVGSVLDAVAVKRHGSPSFRAISGPTSSERLS